MATTPRTISQRIALEGAEELQKQLEAIGRTGEDAFKRNADAIALAARRLEGFVTLVARVETAFAGIGRAAGNFGQALGGVGTALNAFESSVGRVVRNVALLAGGGGLIGAAGVGLARFATSAAKAADDTQENASAIGLSTEAYRRLQTATENAGLKQGQFQQVMARLNDQFSDARKAQTDFRVAQQRAADGVQFTDEQIKKLSESVNNSKNIFTRFRIDVSRGLGLEEAILQAGDALKGLRSDQERAAAGFDFFSARGARAGTALAGIRDAAKGTREEFGLLATIEQRSPVGIAAAESLEKLTKVAKDAKQALGLVFSPVLQTAADALRQAILRNFNTFDEFAKRIERTVRPVIEDLIRLISGDDANIQNRWIVETRDKVVELGQSISKVVKSVIGPAFEVLMAGAQAAADGINKVFGTNLTGTDVAVIAVLGKVTGAFDALVKAANLAVAAVVLFFAALRVPAAVLTGLALIGGAPAVVAAAFATAAAAIVLNWDKVKEAGLSAWDEISRKWKTSPVQSAPGQALPKGQSGLDLLLTRLQLKAIQVWETIRAKWSQSPIPALPGDRLPIEIVFERLGQKAGEVWEAIRAKWSESPIPKLPDDKLPIELVFERLVEKAQAAWDKIRAIWSKDPTDTRTELPKGQSALSALISGRTDDQQIKNQAAATSELTAQRARLGQQTLETVQAEQTLAQATTKTGQVGIEAALATVKARQEQQNLARAAQDSAPIFVQVGEALRALGTEGAVAASKARQEQQNLNRTLGDSAPIIVKAGEGFRSAAEGAAQLGRSTRNLPDLATPMKTLGDEAARAGTRAKTLPPIFVEVNKAFQGGQQSLAGFARAMRAQRDDVGQAEQSLEGFSGAAEQAGSSANDNLQEIGSSFGGLVQQARSARDSIVDVFSGIQAAIAAALSGGGAGGPGVGPTEGALAAGAGVGGGPFASLVESARQAAAQILEVFRQLGSQLGAAISGAGAVAAAGAAPVAGGAEGAPAATGGPFSALVEQARVAVQSVLQIFGQLGQEITQAIVSGLQGLGPALQSAFQQIPQAFQSVVQAIEQAVQQMLQTVRQASQEAIRALQEVVRAAREAGRAVEEAGQGRGFASGGYTGGGSRQRVAGVVHGGEYVQPARVVRQPGVLSFMEALRRTGDLQAVIERFTRGFDLGGLVPGVRVPQMAYAGGGAVSRAGTPINLFLPDGRRLATVMGDSLAVQEIKTEAVRSSYLSLGRKPSRYT